MWTEGRTDRSELCDVDRGTDRWTDMTYVILDLRNFLNVPITLFIPHRKHSKSQLRLQY